MNLLDSVWSVKRLLRPGWIFFIPVFFGCETSTDQGVRYDLESSANVLFQEFTLPTTNFYIDSLSSGSEGSLLVGNFTDPLTGQVTAEGYFQYQYQNGPLPVDSMTYDSVVLSLFTDIGVPNQSAINQEFSVRELTSNLLTGATYLASLEQDKANSIGLFSSSINTESDSIFSIKLSDSFGQALYDRLEQIEGEGGSASNEIFTNLALVPEAGSEGISQINLFRDTTAISLFSSYTDEDTSFVQVVKFFIGGQNYSYIERDHQGSPFDGVTTSANFDLPDGRAVLDPLLGITSAISIEELATFFSQNDDIIINSAIISIQTDTEDPNKDDRQNLSQFYAFFRKPNDAIYGPGIRTNTFRNVLLSDNGYRINDGTPAVSEITEDEGRLVINCTLFVQQLLREYVSSGELQLPDAEQGLANRPIDELVPISPIDVTLRRSIFTEEGITLRLYYTQVD